MNQKVKFLPKEHIEAATLGLLAEYSRKFGEVVRPPIPVEEILEAHLGLDFAFDDLPKLLGIPDALGATWVQQRRVVIDQSLDPTNNSSKHGRYRFTVAHELGHWELHRHLFLTDPGQGCLFLEKTEPSIVCRSKAKDPMEWQADTFAGYMLMPKEMVFEIWRRRHGELDPYIAAGEIADLNAKWGLADDDRPTVEIARELAREFKVSGQAMQIRLIGLGLIRTEVPAPDLFTR